MKMGGGRTKQTFFLNGSFRSIFMELKIIFSAEQTNTFHGKARDLSIFFSTLKTKRLYRNNHRF
jgi:hypothetical protein